MQIKTKYNLVTILGPTASGKTRFAALLANHIDGEVISADSRQVYKGMDLGAGKDYTDYSVNGELISFHLIDIVDPGYEYNVYEYQKDFVRVFSEIKGRGKFPVLCGGSGLYIEAVLKSYRLITVPRNNKLRKELESKSTEELTRLLSSYKKLHNITDIVQRKRLIRALEIEMFYKEKIPNSTDYPQLYPLLIGIQFDRESVRERITARLNRRLEMGMVDEVKRLIDAGVTAEKLMYYGLEYKYIAMYLTGKLKYKDMVARLNTAIHQFSKRQMTWFRRMEKGGMKINWLDGYLPEEEKLRKATDWLNRKS